MEVRSFMLATGQEIIAELVQETGAGYKIKKPLAVHMMRGPDGAPALGLAQWSMVHHQDQVIELLDQGLLARPIKLMEEVEASYISNVSGILVPPTASGRILQG